jgi:hypothetical protein
VACTSAYKTALVAHGLSEFLYEQCRLSSFIPLYAQRCRNLTVTPLAIQQKTEATCAPGHCNEVGDCTETVREAYTSMAGPGADPVTVALCGIFFSSTFWPQYGLKGSAERTNCYWDFPPELQVRFLDPDRTHTKKHQKLLVTILVATSAVVVVLLSLFTCLVMWRRKRNASEALRDHDLFKAKLSKSQSVEPLKWYSYSELRSATQNFSAKLLLGKGGSGKVYLGELVDGSQVAVKEISRPSTAVGLEVS